MCPPLFCAVYQLKQHRIGDVQSRQFVERARRQEYFAAVVRFVSVGAGHHGYRIASKVLIKATSRHTAAAHVRHSLIHHGVVVAVEESSVLR